MTQENKIVSVGDFKEYQRRNLEQRTVGLFTPIAQVIYYFLSDLASTQKEKRVLNDNFAGIFEPERETIYLQTSRRRINRMVRMLEEASQMDGSRVRNLGTVCIAIEVLNTNFVGVGGVESSAYKKRMQRVRSQVGKRNEKKS
jgi:hypothetical protein